MSGQYQNNIPELQELELFRYENIFKVYTTGDKQFFHYNIVKNIKVPSNLNEQVYTVTTLNESVPLTTLSFKHYGTTHLWWLICLLNGIQDPFDTSYRNKEIKILKKEYVRPVLDYIKQQAQ